VRLLFLLLLASPALASDLRYCGPPARDAEGRIVRSSAARAAFVRMYPCPATGTVTGSCPGWSVDHVIPLAVGGCDAPHNMQWLPNAIKSCALATGLPCKDRWEQRVYRVEP